MSIGIVVLSWIYNFVVGKIGKGVAINLEQSEE
jgi:hypothetical protein